jgi:tetratricopeptide (TPR) repeat protein
MQQIEQGLAQYPNSVVLLRNKLHILADVRGDNQQALGVSKQLCELLPESVSERLGLAVCHTRLGQYETAKQMDGEVEPMIAQPLDRLQLACVYSLLSKQDASYLDKSLASLQKALAAQPLLAGRASRDPDLKPLLAKPKAQQFLAAAKQLLPDTTPEATRVE